MKQKLLTIKSLLVAVLLGVGVNGAWATPTSLYERGTTNAWATSDVASGQWSSGTVTEGLSAAGGKLSQSGTNTAYSSTKTISPTSGYKVAMTAVAIMGVAPGRSGSYDYIKIGGVELRVLGQDQVAQVYVDGAAQGTTVSATRNTAYTFNVLINQKTGKVTYSVSGGATIAETTTSTSTAISNVEVGHYKAGKENYETTVNLTNISITEEEDVTPTYGYTINYKDGEETVKTSSGTAEVDAVIPVESSFWVSTKKYAKNGGEPSSLTIVAGENNLDVAVSEVAKYTCTVNAKAGDVLLATKNESVYDGESTTIYYQMAYANEGKWYFVDKNGSAPGYGVAFNTVTSNQTQNVTTYTLNNDVVYFGEAENMTLVGSWAADGAYLNWRSNGGAKRMTANSYIYTSTIAPGVYDVTMWARNQRSAGDGTETLPIFLRDEDGNLTDLGVSFPGWARGGFEAAYTATITIPDDSKNYSVVINNNTAYTSNLEMDYVYVAKKNVSVTVTAAGYATYVNSDYNLDFTSTTIKAYTAKVNTSTKAVELTQINKVPAGTPVLLYAEGGETEAVPVSATADTPAASDLIAGTGAAVATDGGEGKINYILNNVSGIGFYKAAGQVVATNRAYLQTTVDAAAAPMFLIFNNETTSIGASLVNNEQRTVNSVYNLAGQRVAQPTKGLYIVNGKKAIIK